MSDEEKQLSYEEHYFHGEYSQCECEIRVHAKFTHDANENLLYVTYHAIFNVVIINANYYVYLCVLLLNYFIKRLNADDHASLYDFLLFVDDEFMNVNDASFRND